MRNFGNGLLALTLGVFILPGCGGDSDVPELMPVTGVITFDGAPLAGADILFTPTSGQGRPASAVTSESGEYTLSFSSRNAGAMLGAHSVTVSKVVYTDDEEDDGKETLPKKYRTAGTLTADVTAEDYEFNFDLVSGK